MADSEQTPGSLKPAQPNGKPSSPRRRRLRNTAIGVAALVVASAAGGYWVYRQTRPETYRPGEQHEGITGNLTESLPSQAPQPRFFDATVAAGLGAFRSFAGPRSSQLPEDMGSGAAFGDYDNDGDDDLFLVSAGGTLGQSADRLAPSRLYENRGDGTFREYTSFPETRIHGMAAAWGDYDGDGWLDLVVTGYRTILLFHNERGRLRRVESFDPPDGFWAGASWGDFDNDRDLDLYVCGYVRYEEDASAQGRSSQQFGALVPFTLNPASYEPERNLLFRNDAGTLVETAEALGVDNATGRSLSALWHDFDANGWLDLYVANDVSDNALFLNRDGRFEDASHAAWVADYRGAMGLAAGDWNRDGDDDLFVTHWIAQENALYDSLLNDLGEDVAAGDRQLTFADQSALAGLGQPSLHSVGWGTAFADFDSDGWLDLVVNNGSTFEGDGDPRPLKPQAPFLFWNRGDFFHDLAPHDPSLAAPGVGRGLAVSDYDGDGDQDILLVDLASGVRLLRNEMQQGNWIAVRLRSRIGAEPEPAGHGDGTTVIVRAGQATLRRSVTSASYLSQSSRTLHFGLGAAAAVESVEVLWLAGESETWSGLGAGAVWELTEGDSEARRRSATPLDERARVLQFWETQRAAMRAVKREGDLPRAVELFRAALELDPDHTDSRYYLASSLAAMGQPSEALSELTTLLEIDPRSHRALKQWGTLRALTASTPDDLVDAVATLDRARQVNPEETGTLIALGEVEAMRGEHAAARAHLAHACQTNPRAVGGFFLRAYLAWKAGDAAETKRLLGSAREALGPEWKPAGTTAEGDSAHGPSVELSPLSRFWAEWDGGEEAAPSFEALDEFLADPFVGS